MQIGTESKAMMTFRFMYAEEKSTLEKPGKADLWARAVKAGHIEETSHNEYRSSKNLHVLIYNVEALGSVYKIYLPSDFSGWIRFLVCV